MVKSKVRDFSLNVPSIMNFDDYHEIRNFVERINELRQSKDRLKFTEITNDQYNDYGYTALFYVGKQDKQYKAVLKEYKLSLKKELKS